MGEITSDIQAGYGITCAIVLGELPIPPTILSSSPPLGDTDAGTPIHLTVTGLVTAVTINGVPCTSIVQTFGDVYCVAPALATGTYNIQCSNVAGSSNVLAAAYKATNPGVIISSGVPRWYDSEKGLTLAGALVTGWADSGAGGKSLIGAVPKKPHYVAGRFGDAVKHSVSWVRADDTNTGDKLALAAPIALAGTISRFWVDKCIIARFGNDGGDLFATAGGAIMATGHENGGLRVYDADTATDHKAGSEMNDGAPRVHGITMSVAAGLKFYTNGTLFATQTISSAGPAWQNFGGQDSNNIFEGEVACMVVVEAILTTLEISELSQWMYSKFVARSHATNRVATSTPWTARDGGGLVALGSDLYMLGGWNSQAGYLFNGNTSKTTNEVWKSSDQGLTWTNILAGAYTYPNTTRWTPRHFAGWVVQDNLIYVIGSDPFNGPAGYYNLGTGPGTSDVWSSPDGVNWTLVTNAAPWGPRILHMCASFQGNLYVMGGQRDLADDATALKDVWRSIDGGANWTQLTVPSWTHRGLCSSPLAVFNNKLWVIGGGVYGAGGVPPAGALRFNNDVWTYDGLVWANVLADGVAPWKRRQYHQCVTFEGKLWVINGFGDAVSVTNIGDCWSSPDGVTWTEQTIVPWRTSHADGMAVLSDRIVLGPGNGDIGQPSGAGLGHTYKITRNGMVP